MNGHDYDIAPAHHIHVDDDDLTVIDRDQLPPDAQMWLRLATDPDDHGDVDGNNRPWPCPALAVFGRGNARPPRGCVEPTGDHAHAG